MNRHDLLQPSGRPKHTYKLKQHTSREGSEAIERVLRRVGLRPTRQRTILYRELFERQCRHVNAEDLHQQVLVTGNYMSLATVYNTLNQFADAGLLRKVAVSSGRGYYDTAGGDHHHFHIEAEDRIIDVPPSAIQFARLPPAPPGYLIAGIDVVIRLERENDADLS